MCIPPRSQTAQCEVKIEIFVSLWLLLKGQSGEILLGVNTSTMKDKILSHFFIRKPKSWTPQCHVNSGVEFSNFVIEYLGLILT